MNDEKSQTRLLEDVRVLDLSNDGAASRAASLLGDYGADVMKVVTTDPRLRPSDAQRLADWLVNNRSKRIAIADPGDRADREAVDNLAKTAEIIVAGTVERLVAFGLDVDSLATQRIVLFTPAYLPEGAPWFGEKESAELLEAITGLSTYQSSYSGDPVTSVYPFLERMQGVWAATTAVAALIESRESGAGQSVSVSGFQAALIFGNSQFTRPTDAPDPDRAVGPGGLNPVYTRYECADGRWIFVGGLGPKFARAVVDATGMHTLLEDPRIGGRVERLWSQENSSWAIAEFAARFRQRQASDWVEALEAADIPCTQLLRRDQWLESEQMQAMSQRITLADPVIGDVVGPGAIIDSLSAPATIAPATAAVSVSGMTWLAPEHERISSRSATRTGGPLARFTVGVLGSFVAGPYVGCLLASLGANAIKIESPEGDPWRVQGFGVNRGYRALAVDLRQDASRDAILSVLSTCDVVVNNFRLGVMERLGIGDSQLRSLNDRVVTVAVTAYGERGPLSKRPGYDTVLQAASGMMYAQGGDEEPVVYSMPVNDLTTAVCGAFAAVLGLHAVASRDEGLHLSTALGTTAAFLQAPDVLDYPNRSAGRSGGRDFVGTSPSDRYYPVRDGIVRIQVPTIEHAKWIAAGLLVDQEQLRIDPVTEITRVLGQLPRHEALSRLKAAEVPAVPARKVSEVAADPVSSAVGVISSFTTSDSVDFFAPGALVDFDRTMVPRLSITPGIGEHSVELLRESGVPEVQIDALLETEAVVQGGPMDIVYMPPYR
ncbi:CoA transferase [Microbacterium sp. A94]|uniref:CaiB/BaiF CoA-transferase family protein n=1 Tax=Microbacterium sp. A94 TaxID=3450717 RepID=UPI003F445024